MNKLGTITPDQIEATCNKHVCNYFFVTDINGKTRHVQLGRKQDLQTKIAETVQTINGLPDNMFVITFIKSSNGKNPAQYPYYLSKTPAPQTLSAPGAPQTIINTPFEPARSMEQALTDGRKIAELTADNKRLQDELARIGAELENLKNETLAEEEEKELAETPTNVDKLGGFLKDILPQFMPLADKYFEIQDKKLALQAMALNKPTAQIQTPAPARHPFRPWWNPEETEKTIKYFEWLQSLPDAMYYKEMAQCAENAPGLHAAILTMEQNDNGQENA